ncbi:MAG: hypothetical protein MJZ37_06605 [Bacilli bacterium]|nr:hypothetical protein [Bacilli bacterium]
MDKTSVIFGNKMPDKVVKKATKSKEKYIKKFGDDSNKDYKLGFIGIDCLDFIDAKNVIFSKENEEFPKKAVIVGNIRMGFGHYRISIAMASAAKALGYTPVWLDLASFDATGSKMIRAQNDLYSMGSRLSQISKLFNHFVWEPMNKEGFKKISYNAVDQKNSENLVPIFRNIPKDTPYIATHVWPSQAAIHSGMTHVVNAIPDNWPMALHLSEGAIHTVQTNYAYYGYKRLDGFSKKPLNHMPDDDIKMVGKYVDHEIVKNLEKDNDARRDRIANNKPIRILFTVGGAGAGAKQLIEMINHLLPYVKENKVSLFINFGDHLNVYEKLCKKIPGFADTNKFFDQYSALKDFVAKMNEEDVSGIYSIYHQDIFPAVYSTNLLMRKCDILVTKPSELVFYPIPKIFMRHIGGHEAYGAIHGAELGDATYECDTKQKITRMLDDFIHDKSLLLHMIEETEKMKELGLYNGAYECVKLAVKGRDGK